MIKSYQEGNMNGGSFVLHETKRIQDTRKNKRIEEADKKPVASLSAHLLARIMRIDAHRAPL